MDCPLSVAEAIAWRELRPETMPPFNLWLGRINFRRSWPALPHHGSSGSAPRTNLGTGSTVHHADDLLFVTRRPEQRRAGLWRRSVLAIRAYGEPQFTAIDFVVRFKIAARLASPPMPASGELLARRCAR